MLEMPRYATRFAGPELSTRDENSACVYTFSPRTNCFFLPTTAPTTTLLATRSKASDTGSTKNQDQPLVLIKGIFPIRPRRPATKSPIRLHPFERTATSPTPFHPLLVASSEVIRVLFDLSPNTLEVEETTQLPHKSFSGVLPFAGEDSGARHQGLIALGFAPFKPP